MLHRRTLLWQLAALLSASLPFLNRARHAHADTDTNANAKDSDTQSTTHEAPSIVGSARPRLVVIGGGVGGSIAAKRLAQHDADLTLIDYRKTYTHTANINSYLVGFNDAKQFNYSTMAQRNNIRLVTDWVDAIDPSTHRLHLESGATIDWDRLIIAPGVSLIPNRIEAYDSQAAKHMPHATASGESSFILKEHLEALGAEAEGKTLLICPVAGTQRYPLAHYERATLLAHRYPKAQILLIDSPREFLNKELFQQIWQNHYPNIEYIDTAFTGGGVTRVDTKNHTIHTGNGSSFRGDLINIIPPQSAGYIARHAGLAERDGWCRIHAETSQSIHHKQIYVIGDAANFYADTQASPDPQASSRTHQDHHRAAKPRLLDKAADAATTTAERAVQHIALDYFNQAPKTNTRTHTLWSRVSKTEAIFYRQHLEWNQTRFALSAKSASDKNDSFEEREKNLAEAQQWLDELHASMSS